MNQTSAFKFQKGVLPCFRTNALYPIPLNFSKFLTSLHLRSRSAKYSQSLVVQSTSFQKLCIVYFLEHAFITVVHEEHLANPDLFKSDLL